jgi:hypothetical protein
MSRHPPLPRFTPPPASDPALPGPDPAGGLQAVETPDISPAASRASGRHGRQAGHGTGAAAARARQQEWRRGLRVRRDADRRPLLPGPPAVADHTGLRRDRRPVWHRDARARAHRQRGQRRVDLLGWAAEGTSPVAVRRPERKRPRVSHAGPSGGGQSLVIPRERADLERTLLGQTSRLCDAPLRNGRRNLLTSGYQPRLLPCRRCHSAVARRSSPARSGSARRAAWPATTRSWRRRHQRRALPR